MPVPTQSDEKRQIPTPPLQPFINTGVKFMRSMPITQKKSIFSSSVLSTQNSVLLFLASSPIRSKTNTCQNIPSPPFPTKPPPPMPVISRKNIRSDWNFFSTNTQRAQMRLQPSPPDKGGLLIKDETQSITVRTHPKNNLPLKSETHSDQRLISPHLKPHTL